METEAYYNLIDLIDEHKQLIIKQAEVIEDLLEQNAEQENMINAILSKEFS